MKNKLTNLLLGLTLFGCVNSSDLEIPKLLDTPEYMNSVAVGNNGKEIMFFCDTDNNGVSDLGFFYEITGTSGNYYLGDLRAIRSDLNEDGIFDLNETIWKKEE